MHLSANVDKPSRSQRLRRVLIPSTKAVQFVLVERLLGLLARSIDIALVVAAISDPSLHGAVNGFIIFTPIYFILCALIVVAVDALARWGVDITGIENLRSLRDSTVDPQNRLTSALRWLLLRRSTIFWIGSWFYLDPDYVTLLLRDRHRSIFSAIATITIPSVLISMIVWVPMIWLAVNAVKAGYTWAKWFLQ